MLLEGGAGTARETRRRLETAGLLEMGSGELIMENSREDSGLIQLAYELLNGER